MKRLREEVPFLRALVGDMADDLDEMRLSQRLAVATRATAGLVRGVLGVLGAAFSVVLVVRV